MRLRHLPIALAAVCVTAVMAAPPSYADYDALPDNVESALCAQPAFVTLLDTLPAIAGACVGGTGPYRSPLFEPNTCSDCTSWTVLYKPNVKVNNAYDTDPVATPPLAVPPLVTPPTEPVDQPVGTVQGVRQPDGEHYCIFVTPQSGPPTYQCLDLGADAGALAQDFGPTELAHVDSYDPPDTPPVTHGPVVVDEGRHVPSYSFDVLVEVNFVESRLNQILGPGLVSAWDPVDLDDAAARQWWVDNGDQTNIRLRFTLREDGTPVSSLTQRVPYLGQLYAAFIYTVIAAS